MKVLGIAVLVFAGVLMLVPRRYKAQATVIVLPPRFLPEVRTQPLSVSTVRTLLESGELLQLVIDRLRTARTLLDTKLGPGADAARLSAISGAAPADVARLLDIQDEDLATYLAALSVQELRAILSFKRADLEDMTTDDLAKVLSSEETVEKKTASDLTFSPLVQLYAIGDSGAKAQALANTWATLFERKYDQLTRQKTTQQYDSIVKQQNTSQAELEDIQTTIVVYKSRNNIELLQRLVDENSENFRNFSQQLVVKEAALDRLRGRLARLHGLIAAMEMNGEWVGRVRTDAGVSTTTVDLSSSKTSADTELLSNTLSLADDSGSSIAVAELYSRIHDETLRSGSRLASAMTESNKFYEQQPLEMLEKERDQLQQDYLDAVSRLRSGTVGLGTLKETLAKLDEQLSATQPYITLSTSLPEEAIGTAIASGRRQDLGSLAQVQFQRQELNPVWEKLGIQRAKVYEELQNLEGEMAQLNTTVPRMDAQLRRLQNELYQARQSEIFIKENLDRWQKSNEQLFRNYVELTNNLSSTAQEIALIEQEVRALSQSVEASRLRIETYQQKKDKATADLEVLELRQRAIQRFADLLLQKVQEAQIAVREDVSDVSVAAHAVAPERHYFPQRSVLLLVATLLTAGILLGLLARQRYMQLREA